MTPPAPSASPPPRDHRQERIDTLTELTDERAKIDPKVRGNLALWYDQGPKPENILVRPGFVRRVTPLSERELRGKDISDRPKPNLPRQPPLALLTSKPRGIGLRTALTLLFLAQTNKAFLRKSGQLRYGIDADEDREFGLLDLIAILATHDEGRPSHLAVTVKTNRRRQIRTALATLSSDEIGMVELGTSSAQRFRELTLRVERGAHGRELPTYSVPKLDGSTNYPAPVAIPVDFFLKGWIHALTNREIAMWLMLRAESALPGGSVETANDDDAFDLEVEPKRRLLQYDLSRATWDTHDMLERVGLIDVQRDPNRRANGTTVGGKSAQAKPHKFRLNDIALTKVGPAEVLGAL